MAHTSQLEFMELLSKGFQEYFSDKRVLEIGSLDINGTTRSFFRNCEYIGIDVAPGAGVDVVCEGQKYDAPAESFDVVVSCEVMEHNPYWADTFKNMIRLCRPGGLVVMSCATIGRPEHGTARTSPDTSPLTVAKGWNYYKNLVERDFRNAMDIGQQMQSHRFWVNWSHYDLYFVGVKKATSPSQPALDRWANAEQSIDAYINAVNQLKVFRYRSIVAGIAGDRWFSAMNRLISILSWLHRSR